MTYYSRPKFKFYPKEIRDLTVAMLVLTLSLALVLGHFKFYIYLPIAFLAVITGFFAHEMSHKYISIKYGYPAAFRSWNTGLLIALATSFFGFLFAAPGAVVVYGAPSREENGKISAAGPISNLIIGSFFFALAIVFSQIHLLFLISFYIFYLNFFLAFFNLLPIPPMDGLKILYWNSGIYAFLLILSLIGVSLPYILAYFP